MQVPITARRAEPNGGPRVATMGEYRSWSPRDTTRWSLRIVSLRVITKGSTRNWVNPQMNCQSGRDRHRNVSKPRKHFIFKTKNEKVHEEPSFVGCCPLVPAPSISTLLSEEGVQAQNFAF